MAGRRQAPGKPTRHAARLARQQEFWRQRLDTAADPGARLAVAADYLRVALTRASAADADRVARTAVEQLLAHAKAFTTTTGEGDEHSDAA